jgi:hypothetical protein
MASMVRKDHAFEYSGDGFMVVKHAGCILNG